MAVIHSRKVNRVDFVPIGTFYVVVRPLLARRADLGELTYAAPMPAQLAADRVVSQLLARPAARVADVVGRLGAIQAQDYPGALWSIGLRAGATRAAVEEAVVAKEIVRTWPMRGTLHFVPAKDIRWMVALDAERRMKAVASRHRQLGLTAADFRKAEQAAVRALEKEPCLSRGDLLANIGRGVSVEGQRGPHILIWLSLHGVVCFGPHRGKTPTFVLLDAWLPDARLLPRDEALALLGQRYFEGHAPATIADFAWWCGQTLADARRAHGAIAAHLVQRGEHWLSREGAEAGRAPRLHLLPGFDEMLLGYRDRTATLGDERARVIAPGNGFFRPTVIDRGRVVGTWSRAGQTLSVTAFTRLPTPDLARAVAKHAAFLELPLELLPS